ncbi:MAG: hypothetical protein ACRD1O_07110, partial [Terriglobia bacterium]
MPQAWLLCYPKRLGRFLVWIAQPGERSVSGCRTLDDAGGVLMPLQVAVPKETQSGERRVAMTPRVAERLVKLGITVMVEAGAGVESGMLDADYSKFAALISDQRQLYGEAGIVLRVHVPEIAHIQMMSEGAVLVSFVHGSLHLDQVKLLRDKKITTFAMELVPRISRAQNVDALSSQAMAAGYKAALLAANRFERFFP